MHPTQSCRDGYGLEPRDSGLNSIGHVANRFQSEPSENKSGLTRFGADANIITYSSVETSLVETVFVAQYMPYNRQS